MNNSWTIPQSVGWSIPEKTRKSWDRKIPYYMRFRDHFATMIEAGAPAPGSRLPPERILAKEFSLTRVTVRQALIHMEAEGLVFREERRGWFVSPPRVHYDPTANTSFSQSVAGQGRKVGTQVLGQRLDEASQWEAELLGCKIGDPVYVISRLRTVDGRAILVEKAHIKAERCPGLLEYSLDQSLTDLMAEKYAIVESRVQISMRPTAIPEIPASALNVATGTPGLYLSRTIRDQFNEVIEFDEEFWRHDAIDIRISSTNP